MPTDYANLPTPEACYADFCLIPVRPFRAVHYPLPAAPLPAAHCLVLSPNPSRQVGTGSVSVAKEVAESSMRVGTRTDKKQPFEDKVKRVEALLKEGDSAGTAA
ncbi:hypothetical protein VdG1_04436 [Verticillium dahliae VDG1]|nr:hypothetical protein VdG1_04436 [Verticillium dahliae VDG1]